MMDGKAYRSRHRRHKSYTRGFFIIRWKEVTGSTIRSPRFRHAKTATFMAHVIKAKDLWICWSDNSSYWEFVSDPRFGEVARLLNVCWLEMKGSFNTAPLSPATRYTVSLIVKFTDQVRGLEESPVNVSLQIGDGTSSNREVFLFPESPDVVTPEGGGEWKEVKMGGFVAGGDGGVMNFRLKAADGTSWKSGIVIGGIEIRPEKPPSSGTAKRFQYYGVWLAFVVLLLAAGIIFVGKRGP